MNDADGGDVCLHLVKGLIGRLKQNIEKLFYIENEGHSQVLLDQKRSKPVSKKYPKLVWYAAK